ncbi:hypothetical protein BDA99DRAFT_39867 [Phascolomyces articulosus]|uniref:Uncharacterized protein n=1 Tax=Phascolomyces articulosus TaxID=60185 RepID=A0AAD5K1K2_9FUNG|nr:hypothetical protein BDA99DRAFT_39867 [Phascolomyces articulosus]
MHNENDGIHTTTGTRRQRRHSAGDVILNHHYDDPYHNSHFQRRSYHDDDIQPLEIDDEPPAYTEVIEQDDNYRPKKRRRRRWSFTALMKRITPKLISLTRSSNNSSSTRSIRTVLSSRPIGDVLDEYQQQDILHQLHSMNDRQVPHLPPPPPSVPPGPPHAFPFPVPSSSNSNNSRRLHTGGSSSGHRSRLRGGFQRGRIRSSSAAEGEDLRRIASLDRIWVFRLLLGPHGEEEERIQEEDVNDGTPVVWTTFDYDNQMILMNQHESEKGIEIFDSHIRQGQLPVLVIPKRQRGYFPMDRTGNAIVTLEIACLPNTKDTLFVMRHYSPP